MHFLYLCPALLLRSERYKQLLTTSTMKKQLILAIIFILISNWAFGQITKDSLRKLPKSNSWIKEEPVIYHDKESGLPDTISVQGLIVDISPGYCGTYCIGGVVKIKLEKEIQNYDDQFVYLVTPCVTGKDEEGTRVSVIATKYTKENKECYYRSVNNTINSNGTPFYKLSENEANKIK